MAAPVYTTDLTTLTSADGAGVSEPPTPYAAGAVTSPDTDYFIQGTGCATKSLGTGSNQLVGLTYMHGSAVTINSPNAVFIWAWFGAPNGLDTLANGGMRVIIGNAISPTPAFKMWSVYGGDTHPYGGWKCVVVDPSVAHQFTEGSPTSVLQGFGLVIKQIPSISKGNPFAMDAIRYGRGELRANGGETANYATFAGAAAQNDSVTNRWGLLQAVAGGYLWQGLMVLGYSTAVDFRDSNVNISVQDTFRVTADFNTIEVRNASSRVDWTGVSILALGTTSRGRFVMTDNATVNLIGCTFTDMNTFTFLSNAVVSTTTFRRCGLVTQGGASISGCRFEGTIDTVKALLSNNPGIIQNNVFVAGATVRHAIEITTPGTYSLIGNTFTGYGADGGATAAIYNNSGGAVTLNLSGGSTPTVRNGAGASTNIVASVTVTLTGLVSGTEVRIYNRDGSGNSTTEIAGNDNVTSGTFAFSTTAGTAVNIVVFHRDYKPAGIIGYTVPTSDASIPIQQVFDRIYVNP